MKIWTTERCNRAMAVLRTHARLSDALSQLSAEFTIPVTEVSLQTALQRYAGTFIRAHLGVDVAASAALAADVAATERRIPVAAPLAGDAPPPVEVSALPHERFERLVEAARKHSKKGGLDFEALCDELDLSPGEARAMLDEARAEGVGVDVAHGKLHFRVPEAEPNKPAVAITPIGQGREHRIGIFSDLHFGSLYCLREQFTAFVKYAYDLGVRDFFCPGDVLEGCYRHAAFERSAESWEDQAEEYLDALPQLEGMRIFQIDGNHDFTWTEKTGVESGRNLVRLARERGRTDLHFFGSRGALIKYGDTKIEMWHPKRGNAYALSYQLQNKIRDTAPERLPHILLTGHTHQYVKFRRSNVWAFYCGTFQHGDAPYGRSLGGDVSMGGTILDWRIDDDSVVRTLCDTFTLAHHQPKTFDVAI